MNNNIENQNIDEIKEPKANIKELKGETPNLKKKKIFKKKYKFEITSNLGLIIIVCLILTWYKFS
ncbi:hypothetical protein [Bacillus paramycoides]|uniref:hypothetical protein n=1 Tax=Bacillus paramycoides TaxID=2026194 RepID=UPI002E21D21B|nr:hypothetical protein [Bacillus paramycoides]